MIDTLLMSCRVLQRGVERLLCNYVTEKARVLGVSSLHGVYMPTPANKLVCDHYRSLGFVAVGTEPNGTTHWRLDLTSYQPVNVEISSVEEY